MNFMDQSFQLQSYTEEKHFLPRDSLQLEPLYGTFVQLKEEAGFAT